MKPFVTGIAAFFVLAAGLAAQQDIIPLDRVVKSQRGTVTQKIANTDISIAYGRPVARGRELYGSLVPYGRIWHPGANDATSMTISRDIEINGKPPTVPDGVRYVITLDADTRMPREAARRLIGKMAHPLNRPRFDESMRRVVEGYGVLQPRITPSMPSGGRGSVFHRVFSSANGIDVITICVVRRRPVGGSSVHVPRRRREPCPVPYASSSSARLARSSPPVGKSGPRTFFSTFLIEAPGSSMSSRHASMTSPRLCGGMLVAIPTAMP